MITNKAAVLFGLTRSNPQSAFFLDFWSNRAHTSPDKGEPSHRNKWDKNLAQACQVVGEKTIDEWPSNNGRYHAAQEQASAHEATRSCRISHRLLDDPKTELAR